jgi:hypothetical protein
LVTKKPSLVRSPVRNGRSRSSTSLVKRPAASASVRATSSVGTPETSAASRAAFRVRTNVCVGTSTLPPRWPHFFSLASWSSKCTPEAPASIICFISSNALSGPPKPASASATIGANQCVGSPPTPVCAPSMCAIWSARCSAWLMRFTTAGTELLG